MSELLAIDEGWLTSHIQHAKAWISAGGVVDLGPEAAAKLVPMRRGSGSVAIIPVTGFLTQRPTLFSMIFGGTSVEAVASEVVAAMRDSSVSSVVMAFDSPGGSVYGVSEAAAKIRASRGTKPLVSVADPFAASAAYWLAAQADEVVGSPSSITGSIGVLVEHVDLSAALEKEGTKVEIIRYGRNKAIGHEAFPLDDDARAQIQAKVDFFGRMFDADVAKGRGISVEKVRSDFGEGATFTSSSAAEVGLIDRIDTLEEVVRRSLSARKPDVPAARSYDEQEVILRATLAGLKSHE